MSSSEDVNNGSGKKDYFDARFVCESFEKCMEDVSGISLDSYLKGYMELYRFFGFLGSVFSFVASDVISKINILESYQKSERGGHYKTIQSMIDYESANDLLRDKTRPSGARTLLRLHRALEFIASFIGNLVVLHDDDVTSTAAQESYNKTLSKFHPWLIQKGALLAMYTLPTKQQLLKKVTGNHPSQDACILMKQLGEVALEVHKVTQRLYEENDILDLP
ncbi:ceramide-1-phosphate transfer protein-like [Limulus polyphemus]|uniref:Ceramide-1-phosphate transfer protein-like n=1 Tax=Limulus polyphemus TaxID=6850 RepID=A0ABM1BZ70_LIMPO|nr:ceramide-1-phosphate transfer protein-like [Limulus polyphemus]